MAERVAAIEILQNEDGTLAVRGDYKIPEAMIVSVLRTAADELSGRENRAAGCWGAA